MRPSLNRPLVAVLALLAQTLGGAVFADDAGDLAWPREFQTDNAKVLLYQPQPETLKGDTLSARTAVAVTPTGKDDPVLGTVWMTARLMTDQDQGTATLHDLDVTRMVFPDADNDKAADLEASLEQELSNWLPEMDLIELKATLEVADVEQTQAQDLKNDPPIIKYVDYPALLVSLDGKPVYRQIPNSNLTQVSNTPFLIVLDYRTNGAYLFDGQDWLESTDVMGPWKASTTTPPEVLDMTPTDRGEQSIEKALQDASSVPKIIVATKPTELIVTTGAATYSAIDGTDLSYVSNTQSRLVKENSSGALYLLISGRWYTSGSLEGPWSYLPADQLSADFSKIPPDSDIGEVLTSIPGTQQAKDAAIDAAVPVTTTVKRDKAIAVHYDGPPRWEPIEGTQMQYAANTSQSVIHAGDKYFCAEEGVWYVASAPTGPWQVAVDIPDEIYTTPPSSPVYNTTFLYVFGYNDNEVYPGYYPGYNGSYNNGEIPLYGTGYYYPPWVGANYYSRPATWGFHMHYNPYGGWGPGFSYGTGYFPSAIGSQIWDPCCWWGPSRWGARGRYNPRGPFDPRGPYDPRGARDPRGRYDNRGPYDRRGIGEPRGVGDARGPADSKGVDALRANQYHSPAVGANNLYSGRNGNVYRHSNQGWQQHGGGGWSHANPSPGVQNHHAARSRGMSMARGGGGGRRMGGGGGRRR